MVSVKEILFRQPPEILYHYTGQKGLLGIIGKKEIWASHTQYLNDQREFRHAIELVRDELSRMVQRADTQAQPFVEEMNQGMHEHDGMESVNVCVCSFSEEGDILSNGELTVTESPSFRSGSLVPYCDRSLRALR